MQSVQKARPSIAPRCCVSGSSQAVPPVRLRRRRALAWMRSTLASGGATEAEDEGGADEAEAKGGETSARSPVGQPLGGRALADGPSSPPP